MRAALGQRLAARGAVQQPGLQARFGRTDAVVDHRGRQTQMARGRLRATACRCSRFPSPIARPTRRFLRPGVRQEQHQRADRGAPRRPGEWRPEHGSGSALHCRRGDPAQGRSHGDRRVGRPGGDKDEACAQEAMKTYQASFQYVARPSGCARLAAHPQLARCGLLPKGREVFLVETQGGEVLVLGLDHDVEARQEAQRVGAGPAIPHP